MTLDAYRDKRDFNLTREPRGKKAPTGKNGFWFVIQKHGARRLHYDLRLEMDGALKSWAVPRGPSDVAGDKRLAVHVEDHPLEYADFEGVIPKGEYGAGAVIVWDRGRWKPIGDWRQGYAKGHLDFDLSGKKLRGRWALIRMTGGGRGRQEKKDNWLLIKGDDEAARSTTELDILLDEPNSVKTGCSLEQVKAEDESPAKGSSRKKRTEKNAQMTRASPDPSALKGVEKAPIPNFVEPALATLVEKPPSGARWVHEIKFDGYRLQARLASARATFLTRGQLDWTSKFGASLAAAISALPVATALIDGELVVENDNGGSDFSALQADIASRRTDRMAFYAFDLLYLDGYDLRAAPLVERKAALEQLLAGAREPLRYSAHFHEDGDLFLRHACRLSLEGVVSKLRDGPYRSGRTKDWRKSKCSEREEFVVGGYLPSTTSRKAIGSLVLGYYEKRRLVHAGRVGTGFTATVAEDLFRRLERIRADASPFKGRLSAEAARGVIYVKPELVAEIEFRGWTADRNLRQASFRGLREDKAADEVVREGPTVNAGAKPRRPFRLTHPDRLYWPDAGVTKEGLADYYSEVWPRIAPFVVGRPLAVVRCPDGAAGQCFFQKHPWRGLSRGIRSDPDPKNPTEGPLLIIDDLDGLIGLVQAGSLEIHPWGSTLAALEQPDMIVMDLDPGDGAAWADVIAAAIEVRDRLKKLGLDGFVKTSGGKGLHVVASLQPKANWAAVKAFTKSLAVAMASDNPDRYIAKATKAKRDGKIFVDYLRNGRGATAVAPYSTRARSGAPVSMPLGWDELCDAIGPDYFTVLNAPSRLGNLQSDPWAAFRKAARPLPSPGMRGKL